MRRLAYRTCTPAWPIICWKFVTLCCAAVKDSDSWSRLCCCCTKNQPTTKAPSVNVTINSRAGETKACVLLPGAGVSSNNMESSSSGVGFFALRRAMAAEDGRTDSCVWTHFSICQGITCLFCSDPLTQSFIGPPSCAEALIHGAIAVYRPRVM